MAFIINRMQNTQETALELSKYKLGWSDDIKYENTPEKGLSEQVVRDISAMKNEPKWMLDYRLKGYKIFERKRKNVPTWLEPYLASLDFENIYYYLRPAGGLQNDWEEVPDQIRETYEKLGIPEAERGFLAGVTAQIDSEAVYHRNQQQLAEQGILFTDMDTAIREYPEIVQKYFATVIPVGDNMLAALNTAVMSGGSFIYVPPGVKVEQPLQAYFRINSENAGQFERTLIIADEGSEVTYSEGCSAPVYSTDSLHSAVVELVGLEGSTIQYQTIQNWYSNVYNLVTKRGRASAESTIQWLDVNLGAGLTMKYPSVYLMGPKARGEVISAAWAGKGQIQDTGAKMIHAASETTSLIEARSLSAFGGRSSYRGLVRVEPDAKKCRSNVTCDALILDNESSSDTYPYMEIGARDAVIEHEATVSKVAEEVLFYLQSRGLNEQQAKAMIVNGFIEPVSSMFPMEYAVELSRLMELNMAEAVG